MLKITLIKLLKRCEKLKDASQLHTKFYLFIAKILLDSKVA